MALAAGPSRPAPAPEPVILVPGRACSSSRFQPRALPGCGCAALAAVLVKFFHGPIAALRYTLRECRLEKNASASNHLLMDPDVQPMQFWVPFLLLATPFMLPSRWLGFRRQLRRWSRGGASLAERSSAVLEAVRLVADIRDGSFAKAEAKEKLKNLRHNASSLPELTSLAKRAGDLGLWQQVIKVLEDTRHLQLTPDIILYGAIMNGCEKSHQWQLALAAFQQARMDGLAPSLVAAGTALSAMGRGSLWSQALMFLEELSQLKLQPNVYTYNATISACERGQQWEMALDILENMEEASSKPDIVSFNAAMNACEKAEQWQVALEVFKSISASPSEITYNILINAFHQASKWMGALEVLEEMKGQNLVPTRASHTMAMAACLRGNSWTMALHLYEALPMAERAHPVLRSLAMSGMGEGSAWPKALQLLQPDQEDTDQGCFNAAMRALEVSHQWLQALQLLEMMTKRGNVEVVPLTMAMSACKRAAQWEAVLLMLNTMPSLHIEPSLPAMSTSLGALLEAGRTSEALELLQASPLLATDEAECNRTFKDFATSNHWQQALVIAQHMRNRSLTFTEGNRALEETLKDRRARPPPPPKVNVKARPAGPRPAEDA
eukprot:symbB.v1.2.008469.t1/scaffold474.1/size199077/12